MAQGGGAGYRAGWVGEDEEGREGFSGDHPQHSTVPFLILPASQEIQNDGPTEKNASNPSHTKQKHPHRHPEVPATPSPSPSHSSQPALSDPQPPRSFPPPASRLLPPKNSPGKRPTRCGAGKRIACRTRADRTAQGHRAEGCGAVSPGMEDVAARETGKMREGLDSGEEGESGVDSNEDIRSALHYVFCFA